MHSLANGTMRPPGQAVVQTAGFMLLDGLSGLLMFETVLSLDCDMISQTNAYTHTHCLYLN